MLSNPVLPRQFSPQVQVIQSGPYNLPQFYQNAQGSFIMPSGLTLQSVQTNPAQASINPAQTMQPGISPGQPIQVC